jgi:biopolymer transport protein ExbB/biopolymer transport protein TolQ
MEFTFKEILKAGGFVFIVLVSLSIYSLAIIIEKYKEFKKIIHKNRIAALKAVHMLKTTSKTEDVIKNLILQKNIVSEIIVSLINYHGSISEKKEYVNAMIDYYNSQWTKRLNVLATIGSTAPFIGLFGTVIGVIRAFKDMAAFQSAGPSVIAHGISEALVNTAMGLFVAIPAVVAYNYFVSNISRFNSEINWIVEQIIARYYKNENP